MNPSPISDDTTFLRRVYLDCLGLMADESRRFMADSSPGKRERLIDHLTRPEFAEHWALKWADVLRTEEKVLDAKGVDIFFTWIRDWIAEGRPMDQFARELVTGVGSTYTNPPANFYCANRDPTTRGETAARLFLAFACNVPAATIIRTMFGRRTTITTGPPSLAASTIKSCRTSGRTGSISTSLMANRSCKSTAVLMCPMRCTGETAVPQFLGGFSPVLDANEDRLGPLATWLTLPSNDLFAVSAG